MTSTDVQERIVYVRDVARMARRLLQQLDGLDQRLSEMQMHVNQLERKRQN